MCGRPRQQVSCDQSFVFVRNSGGDTVTRVVSWDVAPLCILQSSLRGIGTACSHPIASIGQYPRVERDTAIAMQNAARRCLRQAARWEPGLPWVHHHVHMVSSSTSHPSPSCTVCRAAGAAERWRWRRGAACSATVQQLSGLCLTRAPAAQQIPLQQQQRRHRGVAAAAAAQQSQQQQQQSSLARSVRAVPITVLTVAKGNSRGAELMASEWADKLRR